MISNTPKESPKHSVTLAHDAIKNVKELIKKHKHFYVFFLGDKKDPPPQFWSTKTWAKAIKQALSELNKEDNEKVYSGWFTMET